VIVQRWLLIQRDSPGHAATVENAVNWLGIIMKFSFFLKLEQRWRAGYSMNSEKLMNRQLKKQSMRASKWSNDRDDRLA